MAYEDLVVLDAETTITIGGKDKKTGKSNPTKAEGYYLGSRVVEGGKYGPSTLHFLQTAGGNVGVWGKTNLDKQLKLVKLGAMIEITYAGMVETKNNPMHTYKVRQDKSNTIEVSGSGDAGWEDSSFESQEAEDGFDNLQDEEESAPAPVRVSPTAALGSAAERKARLDAVLGKNKTK